MNKNYLLSVFSLCAGALMLSLGQQANHQLFIAINSMMPWQTLWMTITNCGDALFAGSLLFIFLRTNERLLIASIIAGILVYLVIHTGKNFFAITRPEHAIDLVSFITLGPSLSLNNYAMPSGHTATAFMTVMLLAKGYALQRWRLWSLLFAASLIGISRIAVGAHWPADVLAGAACGIVIGHLCAHEKTDLQQAVFKYIAYFIYSIFFMLSIKRVTQVTSVSTAISDGVIILAGIIGLLLWMKKIIQLLKK